MPISIRDIVEIAESLQISRGRFEKIYDRYAERHNSGSKPFKQISWELDHASAKDRGHGRSRDIEDYAEALVHANRQGWLVEFLALNFLDLSTDENKAPNAVRHAVINRTREFVGGDVIVSGVLAAIRRTCRVCVRQPDGTLEGLGSGFLIGPHLVLTNHHVLEEVEKANAGLPVFQFDYLVGEGLNTTPEEFETLETEDGAHIISSSPAAPRAALQATEIDGHLDYAILQVDGLPGYRRSWYDIRKSPDPPDVGEPLEVWAFPVGQPVKTTKGARVAAPETFKAEDLGTDEPRIYHDVNAVGGASGGLILNAGDMEPAAIHAEAERLENPDGTPILDADGERARLNRAVPLCLIAKHAEIDLDAALQAVPPKIGWRSCGRKPILFRERLQRLIYDAIAGSLRILMVTINDTENRSTERRRLGRTYTIDILDTCLDPAANQIFCVSAELISPNAFVTAQRIVNSVGGAEDNPPEEADGETTLEAIITGPLVDWTVSALQRLSGGRTTWLVFDNLDTHPIGTQWASSTFLVALYRRATEVAGLRIVLVGMVRKLGGLDDLWGDGGNSERYIDVEPLPLPPYTGLSTWIESHLSRERNWPNQIAEYIAGLIKSVARSDTPGGRQEAEIEAIAEVIERHAGPSFRRGG